MPMTYAEMRAAADARKTLPTRLRTVSAAGEASRVMGEAADAIEYYERLVAEMRRDAIEADRDARQEIQSAVAETRWQERQSSTGDYGSY